MMHAIRLFVVLMLGIGAWAVDATASFATAAGNYTTVGNTITIHVVFTGSVNVDATTSKIKLNLHRLADDAYAIATASASAVTSANFTYSVQAGDYSTVLTYTDSAALTGVSGYAGVLSGTLSGISVDTPLRVQSVTSSPATGTRKSGDTVTITAAFNRFATSSGFTPNLQLATGVSGGTSILGSLATGSVSALTFAYVVQPGDFSNDLDYLNSSALTLGSGNLDTSTTLSLPVPGAASSLSANSSVVVDGIAPTLTITTASAAQKNSPIIYAITANENVSGFTAVTTVNGTATLTGSGSAYSASLVPKSTILSTAAKLAGTTVISVDSTASLSAGDPVVINGQVYLMTVVGTPALTISLSPALTGSMANGTSIFPASGVMVTIGAAINAAYDLAGNGSAVATDIVINYDPTPPAAIITPPASATTTADFSVKFSEVVTTVLKSTDLSVTNGTVASIDATANPTFVVKITPTSNTAPITLNLLANAVKDAAGNNNLAATAIYDKTPPTILLGGAAITGKNPAELTLAFNKAINPTTLTLATATTDFNLPAGVTVTAIILDPTNTSALVSFNLPVQNSAYTISVKAGAVTDANGNISTATPSTTVTYNADPPVLTLTGPTTSQNILPIHVAISANKIVTGLTTSDCNVNYGTANSLSGSGTAYTVNIVPTASMTLAATATVGVSTISLQGNDTIPAGSVLLIGNLAVRLATTGTTLVNATSVTVNLESALSTTLVQNTPVWKADGENPNISLQTGACQDDNLTASAVTALLQVYYDPTPPMFRIAAPAALNAAGKAVFTLTSSEATTGLTMSKLTATNGTIDSLTAGSDSTSWTVTVTPTDTTTVGLGVNASAAIDSAGNPSLAEPAAAMTIKPYITKVSSANPDGTYGAGIHLRVKVTFSEPVTVIGVPSLLLNLTSAGREALYNSTDGNDLLFDYTTVADDRTADLDYLNTTLTLNGGTIRDVGSTNAILTLPVAGGVGSLAANAAIVVNDGPTGPGKPNIDDQPLGSSGGCGSGSGIALILAAGWLGLGLSRRRRAA